MKKIHALLTAVVLFAAADLGAATLKVVVEGVRAGDGVVLASLFDNEADWLKKSVQTRTVPAESTCVTIDFDGLSAGNYGIWVHDDVNKNGKLDKGLFGKPEEPYGFSNDSGKMFGPADWKAAIVVLDDQDMETHIHLK